MSGELEPTTNRPPGVRSTELDGITTPQWAIIGWKAEGKAYIMASDKLDSATLQAQRRYIDRMDDPMLPYLTRLPDLGPMDYRVELTIGTQRSNGEYAFHIIAADSYGRCLSRLAEIWTPE